MGAAARRSSFAVLDHIEARFQQRNQSWNRGTSYAAQSSSRMHEEDLPLGASLTQLRALRHGASTARPTTSSLGVAHPAPRAQGFACFQRATTRHRRQSSHRRTVESVSQRRRRRENFVQFLTVRNWLAGMPVSEHSLETGWLAPSGSF